jgi:hypothetical protein
MLKTIIYLSTVKARQNGAAWSRYAASLDQHHGLGNHVCRVLHLAPAHSRLRASDECDATPGTGLLYLG